jgi:pyruvate,orthophosphate dikinase
MQTSGLIANNELTRGLGVSPGLITGKVALDPEAAITLAEAGDVPILVRRETSPEDVHGMVVSKGILTGYGGLMSHAAVIARAWGLPAVCGAEALEFDTDGFYVGATYVAAGDLITIDGSTGEVFLGTVDGCARPDPYVAKLQSWVTELEALRRFR